MPRIPPLVFIPGMQCTESVFEGVREHLGEKIPDLRISDSVVGRNRLAGAARDVISGLKEPAILVGHSLGGTVALAAARLYPHMVAGLALICTNPRPPRPDQIEAWHSQQGQAAAGRLDSVVDAVIPYLVGFSSSPSSPPPPFEAARCRQMAAAVGSATFMAQLSVQLDRIDERPGLAKYPGPVLAIAAAEDRLVPVQAVTEIYSAAAEARLEILEQATHMAPMSDAGRVATLLRRWLLLNFPTLSTHTTETIIERVSP